MTNEVKQEIAALYANKTNKVHDIAKAYNIAPATVGRIALEMGGELRRPKQAGKRGKHRKTCPKCRGTIEVKGAKFCPFCGTDIRSEKDLTVEALQKLLYVILALPQGDRDTARDTITKAINLLKEEE
jgi:rRNA maturation endonuclease Nob1